MKRILWVCNTPLPDVQNSVGARSYQEGWLTGISNQIRSRADIDFYYAFPQKKYIKTFCKTINGINFLGFYDERKNWFDISPANVELARALIEKINPDIIHIFGTELPHALEWVNGIDKKERIIVSIQGLTSEMAKVYLKGIPLIERIRGKFTDRKYHCMLKEQIEFHRRGINEKHLLSVVENVTGRTNWDRECVGKINSTCRYYYCGEILRDSFYDGVWDISKIQRYSILISQAYYPIKGFHILISALPLIKRKFPDVMVYVAGNNVSLDYNTPYGRYIHKMIKKFQVESNIVFMGKLTEHKMKKQLLKSHIMLMPSLIENSPNSIGEAMMLGVPVVAAAVGGIPDILSDRTEGYLYPVMNKNALCKRVCRLFENDRLALSFSSEGKKHAQKLYNKMHNAERLFQIYDRVSGESNK